MKVLGIIGTIFGSKTKTALHAIKFDENTEYEIIDLKDYQLPFADGRVLSDYDEITQNLIYKIMDSDALIIGTPIYQASIPGVLKNLFDLLPIDSIRNKTVGIVVTAGSHNHYLVAEYQLIPILNYLKTDVINKYVYITQEAFSSDSIVDDGIFLRLEALSKTLIEKANYNKEKEDKYDF
ncbi:NADH-dependent fmn reductase [Alteracholeplasma palmae J233]|uniref:NADH-dependent fmn reductase n=1 Tax=Alteracholeplasma palmae (strain ATCC 49389 / J233) TaxID=1318466 RepID=U4KN81_ALTPJ|nr:NAD(P)H-dependent oxidoreductase [Alteracholeplasma palmae]CCV63630.1 NADH-dependent fmn reductase [Alteracholeplasma palmae J233]